MSSEKVSIHWKPGETIHDGEWESLLGQNNPSSAPQGSTASRVVDPGNHSSFSSESQPSLPQNTRTVNRLFRPS